MFSKFVGWEEVRIPTKSSLPDAAFTFSLSAESLLHEGGQVAQPLRPV